MRVFLYYVLVDKTKVSPPRKETVHPPPPPSLPLVEPLVQYTTTTGPAYGSQQHNKRMEVISTGTMRSDFINAKPKMEPISPQIIVSA